MSEKMIARWNAIPLERPPEADSLKRGRDEDSDDDISLVSRSPSPRPDHAMDADNTNLGKYDELHRGPSREVITVETKLKPTNKGFELLAKLGWKEGQPVGLDPEGRTDPIPFYVKSDLTGLGKVNQDIEMIETTVSQRRGLDSERQQRETEEQRKAREDNAARKSALAAEITSTLRAFYCELCDKQFKTVAQYDEHTNSYAHHHKVRYKDMQANSRIKDQSEIDKRKEREQKREQKELRKLAQAQGVKMSKAAAPSSAVTSVTQPTQPIPSTSGMEIDGTSVEPKKSGWSKVASDFEPSTSSGGGFKKSGWATVGSSSFAPLPPSNAPPPPPASDFPPLPPPSDTPLPYPSKSSPSHAPSFRNAGWTTLDTAASGPSMPPLPPGNPRSASGWAQVGPSSKQSSARTTWSQSVSTLAQPPSQLPPPPPPTSTVPPPPPASLSAPPPPELPVAASTPAQPVRSNWQQFQKGAGRKKH